MHWWTSIKSAWAIVKVINQFLREYEAMGISRLSPEMGTRDRRRLQLLALGMIDRKDSGLRRLIKIDDAVGPYLQALLDSGWIARYLAGGALQREQARAVVEVALRPPLRAYIELVVRAAPGLRR